MLPRDLLSKFTYVRADVIAMSPHDEDTLSDNNFAGAGDASRNDDDLGVATLQTSGATSPPLTYQNSNIGDSGESGDTMPDRVFSEDFEGHVVNLFQIGPEAPQNPRELPTPEMGVLGTSRRTSILLIKVKSGPTKAVPSMLQATDPARHLVTPTAAFSRPYRAWKPATNTKFFETFGGKKHDKALVAGYQKPELKTYQKAVAGPDSCK